MRKCCQTIKQLECLVQKLLRYLVAMFIFFCGILKYFIRNKFNVWFSYMRIDKIYLYQNDYYDVKKHSNYI